MSFFSLIDAATRTVVSALGDIIATLNDSTNANPPQVVGGISKNPNFEDDFVPGKSPGPTTIYLFVQLSALAWYPRRGDIAVIAGLSYNIDRTEADREGGMTLRMRQQAPSSP